MTILSYLQKKVNPDNEVRTVSAPSATLVRSSSGNTSTLTRLQNSVNTGAAIKPAASSALPTLPPTKKVNTLTPPVITIPGAKYTVPKVPAKAAAPSRTAEAIQSEMNAAQQMQKSSAAVIQKYFGKIAPDETYRNAVKLNEDARAALKRLESEKKSTEYKQYGNGFQQVGKAIKRAFSYDDRGYLGIQKIGMAQLDSTIGGVGNVVQTAVDTVTGQPQQDTLERRLMRYGSQTMEQEQEGLGPTGKKTIGMIGSVLGNVQNMGLAGVGAATSGVPFSTNASLGLMGAGSGGQAMEQARQAGASSGQQLAAGAILGTLEAATEKLPLDNLISIAKTGGKQGVASVLTSALKQAGLEAPGEYINQFAGNIATELVYEHNIGQNETFGEWLKRTNNESVQAGLQGIAQGLLMGGPVAVVNATQSAIAGKQSARLPVVQNVAAKAADAAQGAINAAPVSTVARQADSVTGAARAADSVTGGAVRSVAKDGASAPPTQLPQGVGAKSANFPYIEVPTQTHAADSMFTAAEKQTEGFRPEDATHKLLTNEESAAQANERLEFDYDAEKAALPDMEWGAAETVMAYQYLSDAMEAGRKTGDYSDAIKWKKTFEEKGTQEGQALQARRQFANSPAYIEADAAETLAANKKLNPQKKAGIMEAVSKQAKAYNNIADGDVASLAELIRHNSKIRKTGTLFANKLGGGVEWALQYEAENGNEQHLRDVAVAQIKNIASDYSGVNALEAVKNYRIMSMLSKVATVFRNLVGNGVFDLTSSLTNDTVVPLDIMLSKITGTRSVPVDKSWLSQAKRKGSIDGLAKSVLEVGLDADASDLESKYEMPTGRTFKMTGGIFSRFMSTWAKYEGYALVSTDEFAKGGIQAETTRGINKLKEKGKITQDAMPDAGQTDALYRTFQDSSMLANASMGLKNTMNIIGFGKNGKFNPMTNRNNATLGLGDVALPFAKIPANLGSRVIEHSPLGLVNGVRELAGVLYKAKNGTLTAEEQAKAVKNIGRGMTGTTMIAAFTALSYVGLLKVSGIGADDDDKKNVAALNTSEGKTGTQLNLSASLRWLSGGSAEWESSDTLISLDSLQPINGFMATGAFLAEDIKADGGLSIGSIMTASASGAMQAILDMPVMSSLSDMINSYTYSSADTIGGKAVDAAQGYAASQASSFVPNALRGIATGADTTVRDAYSADTVGGKTIDSVKASIPMLRQTLPAKLNSFGEARTHAESPLLHFMNSNILPSAVTKYNQSNLSSELDSLRQITGETKIYPNYKAPNNFTVNSEQYSLTGEEKRKYLQTMGRYVESEYSKLFKTSAYKTAPNLDVGRKGDSNYRQGKVSMLADIKEAATDKAKQSVVEARGGMYLDANGQKKFDALKSAGIAPKPAYNLYKKLDALTPEAGKAAVSNEQRFKTILSDSSLDMSLKTKAISTYFTGSLLTKISKSDALIGAYRSTGDTQYINMVVPKNFIYKKKEIVLTDEEKKTYNDTFLTLYNGRFKYDSPATMASLEILTAAIEDAKDAAKQAVIDSRR